MGPYALANGYDGAELFVYTVTPTSIAEAPGSPYQVSRWRKYRCSFSQEGLCACPRGTLYRRR